MTPPECCEAHAGFHSSAKFFGISKPVLHADEMGGRLLPIHGTFI